MPAERVNVRRLRIVTPTVRTEDLVDAQEVAELLGLSHRNSVSTYLHRYDDFPRPVIERGAGRTRLWLRKDVVSWRQSRSAQ
jgi:glutathione-regulated potassium-efflux system ancillary protein KefG